jgi:CubicO group peptidase (beta-lactamase class C family)
VVDAATTKVRAALGRACELGEIGVQVAAYLGDDLILDEFIGHTDQARNTLVDSDTLFPIFSVSKGICALALHLQAERGLVSYDDPIAFHWPEFAQAGKSGISISDVLTHRAGIPQMPAKVTPERLGDWNWMTAELARITPIAELRGRSAYMPLSWGWILGEVITRVDPNRRSFSRIVQEEIFAPLGIKDVFFGADEAAATRVAKLTADPQTSVRSDLPPYRSLAAPPEVAPTASIFNLPAVQRACIPAAGGIGTASSVARVFAILANQGTFAGIPFLSEDRVRSFSLPRAGNDQVDQVNGRVFNIGIGGYFLGGEYPPAEPVVGAGSTVLCSPGAGGSIAWADFESGLSVAICHNRMFDNNPPLRADSHPFIALGDAIRGLAGVGCLRTGEQG